MLDVSDARLYYELRGSGPLLALIAAPMDADSFAPAADLLAAGYTVLTTDPRGIKRSWLADRERESSPRERADDLHRLLVHLNLGPAAVFGSSGGAVTSLAHAERYPDDVHTVIAHEPPTTSILPDRAEQAAAVEDMIATYEAGDVGAAWGKFLANANIQLDEEVLAQMFPAAPDPEAAADDRFGFTRMLRGTTSFEPDVAALRDGAPRVLIGLGEDSAGQVCDRTSRALARLLGTEPTMFPGGHTGFADDPETFAARMRELLA
ncbi:alpha/beta hydrolase [Amycolatopsis suaedae]|uniref:Alpha/beta hydrolase n=2 Tax=Amycolatopsis suaedae TaxID=2510978 RepID=A0A4Q7J9U9_9PSEU|nr:alpha/beta hydrolase [Amycolatopsis suaedae]